MYGVVLGRFFDAILINPKELLVSTHPLCIIPRFKQ